MNDKLGNVAMMDPQTMVSHDEEDGLISPTLGINEKVQQLWAEGKEVYHLGFGEGRFPAPKGLIEALKQHARQKSYLAAQGLQPLREAMAQYCQQVYQHQVSADQIVVGPGTKSLLLALLHEIPGDLLLPRPSWVSYPPQAFIVHKQLVWLDTALDNNYIPTPEEIHRACAQVRQEGREPGVVIFNSPNNPTGMCYDQAQVEALAKACQEEGLTILSDELYSEIVHPGQTFHSFSTVYPEGTVVLRGISKSLSLGGWRLGMAIFPNTPNGETLRKKVTFFASEVWSSPTSPVQYAAIEAYQYNETIRQYTDTVSRLHGQRTQALYEGLKALGIVLPQPSGGFYVYASFQSFQEKLASVGVHTSDDLAHYLLNQYHIATLPGSAFGDDPSQLSLRLSSSFLGCETEEKAAQLFSQWEACVDQGTFVSPETHPELYGVLTRFGDALTSL